MSPYVPHQTDQPVLDVDHLTVRYDGRTALEEVTFHLRRGERVAVIGPNGAGKSTLFKAIAGLLTPQAGRVRVYGTPPGSHGCIAYLPQRQQVDWHFPVSVADVVMMGRVCRLGWLGWPKKRDREIVRAALETVGLASLARRPIDELSGGQQQRMFIARALAQEAALVLLDEPLTGLDLLAQEEVLAALEVLPQRGATVMVATHDLEQAARYFDRVLLLNGRLIAFAPPSEALRPEMLLQAYGGRMNVTVEGQPFVIADTCCEGETDDRAG